MTDAVEPVVEQAQSSDRGIQVAAPPDGAFERSGPPHVTFGHPAPPDLALEWAELFYDAFGGTLTFWPLLPRDRARAVALIAASVDPEAVYVALDAGRRTLGVAFLGSRLLRLDPLALQRAYGAWGARWRSAVARLAQLKSTDETMAHLEGFAVSSEHRGRGVGSDMLERLVADAGRRGCSAIELVVGDDNRAVALYERFGFDVVGTLSTGPFRRYLGFGRFIRMRREIAATTWVEGSSAPGLPAGPSARHRSKGSREVRNV